jgi:tetratricopeptide (TPR) repeat protein
VSIAAAVLAALLAAGAPSQPPADIVEAINAAYEAGDYARALELIDRAYASDPRPAYLYSKGEILTAAGDCKGAIEAFEAFLATEPPEVDAAATRAKIEGCEESPPPPEVTPPTEPKPPVDRPPPRPVARDPTFIALLTVGAGLAITGASLLVAARVTADRTGNASTEGAWESDVTRVRGLSISGAVIVGVGSSLVLGAVARAIVLRSR